jgi:predicted phosphohydrolase
MIYLTGDTHGEIDHSNLNNDKVKKACGNEFPDYVIVLGDFGFIWSNDPYNAQEQYWLNWLDAKPFKILFIDGNHENFTRINKLPTVNMFGSEVGQVSDNVFHLRRGHIYTIENKTFFCMGGAMSVDKNERIPFISWWSEEIPSYAEYLKGKENLEKVNYKVDYVLTHTCPISIMRAYFDDTDKYNDSTCNMLESYKEDITFTKWLFGHMHEDLVLDKFSAIYHGYHIIF